MQPLVNTRDNRGRLGPAPRPRCQFVPPYLLRRVLSRTADEHIINCSELTLRLDNQLRAQREAAVGQGVPLAAAGSGTRVIHDARHTEQLPGTVVRRNSDPATGDPAVDEAFDYSGLVWDLFAEAFQRLSVDGLGTPVSVTVHYGANYDNAFWDGSQLVFGDGDGRIFDRFTKPMDVMAHEFTHGVTQFTAGLTYQGQSGALNESVSDVFASMAKQRALGQTADQADWLIGAGLFLPGINAKALRSMLEPGTAYDDPQLGKDPQVATMADYQDTTDDNGGVHINSGIPNRAFALAAVAVGGHSWEQAGRTWYEALTGGQVTAATDFTGFAEATVNAASRLFADDAGVADKVRAAWTEVGVLGVQAPSKAVAQSRPTGAPQTVAVKRSGGFAGVTRRGQLDLNSHPDGPEIRSLLTDVDFHAMLVPPATPDRFIYTLEFGDRRLTVGEQDLTPELHQVMRLVLGDDPGSLQL